MRALQCRVLSSHDELVGFQQQFRRHSGIEVPLDYYQRVTVIGVLDCIDGAHTLIGGYATAPGECARWPAQIPAVTAFQQRVAMAQTIELNSVWLDRDFRKQRRSARFWLALGKDLGSRDVGYIVFVVDPAKAGLARLYRKAESGLIYEGPYVNSSLTYARVSFATPRRFRMLPVLYAFDLLLRLAGGRQPKAAQPGAIPRNQ